MNQIVLAIQGGAGIIERAKMDAHRESAYRNALETILITAYRGLQAGGSALDAVELAVRMLEDCDLFNAGRGSVLTSAGKVEMDAAIMDGQARRAGAVGGVSHIKNPVSSARMVMEQSRHVLLAGSGAEDFARAHHLEMADLVYFITPFRLEQLAKANSAADLRAEDGEADLGTVGAVARDSSGHLAAATSTGGITNKLPGRVGDSPIVGAGIWADDATCAVSCTGTGEFFIRAAFAHEVDALIRLAGLDLNEACTGAMSRLESLGGSGGCVALDAMGNVALPFNTPGMYRGWIGAYGIPHVAIFSGE